MSIRAPSDTMMSRESNNTKSLGKGKFAFPALPLILVLVLLAVLLFPVKLLAASDQQTGQLLRLWFLPSDNQFSVSYTHSVELTEVSEIYQVQNNQIYLLETFFSSYGAGLPATTDYPFEITDQGFRIYDINQIVDPLVYRTGALRANHQLILGQKKIPFLDFSQPAEGVRFELKPMPLLYYLYKEVFQ